MLRRHVNCRCRHSYRTGPGNHAGLNVWLPVVLFSLALTQLSVTVLSILSPVRDNLLKINTFFSTSIKLENFSFVQDNLSLSHCLKSWNTCHLSIADTFSFNSCVLNIWYLHRSSWLEGIHKCPYRSVGMLIFPVGFQGDLMWCLVHIWPLGLYSLWFIHI